MAEELKALEVDAVVIGAGFSGLYATKRLGDIGLTVRSFDAAEGVGGVWTWNRYPGARTDSLAEAYQFSFDKEFAAAWTYSDIHPEQPEVYRYLNRFADHYDLRRHYTFGTTIEGATYDEAANRWTVRTDGGETVTCQFLVTGLGLVSAPIMPDVPGIETFAGEVHHTSRWPETPVDFAGKRVAVIGTGSSGVQIISTIAPEVGELTVYQRTANWCPPTGRRPITAEEREAYLADYDAVWARVRQHPAGWPWELTDRLALETDPAERDAIFEETWNRGGFSLLYETFADLFTDKAANDVICAWMAKKVASIVDDPVTAQKLTPTHPYGAKRPPAADGFLEAFNSPHVSLVDLKETPITEFTEKGIRTDAGEIEFDIIVMATGFDAITGAFTRMDIRGIGGRELNDHWAAGPQTYLGLGIHGFPNLLMVAGPQSPFANLPPGAQEQGNWIADVIVHMRENGIEALHPTAESEVEWTAHLNEVANALVTRYGLEANSWFAGANIEGKPRAFNVYFGGANAHADMCDAEAEAGYPHFERVEVLASAR
jgi:cation diffusion facilitator CzcD-associated flavoprotein CzcO